MKELRLFVLGFGSAGKAFTRLLISKQEEIEKAFKTQVKVTGIMTLSRGSIYEPLGIDLSLALNEIEKNGVFSKPNIHMDARKALEMLEYDALIELTPLNPENGRPAIDHVKTALMEGKHVITANKGPAAFSYKELKALADEKGVRFLCETAVMDGTPVFNLVEKTLLMSEVTGFRGILNSTTNFILDEMGKGREYGDILKEGTEKGFIERDPKMDVEGFDAAFKTAVLINVLMDGNVTPLQIEREGIENITEEDISKASMENKKLKLVSRGERRDGTVKGKVSVEKVPADDIFYNIEGTSSVLSVTTDLMKTISIIEHEPLIEQTAYGPFSDLLRIITNT